MQTQLYFWKPMMKVYQNELELVEKYFNESKPVFEFTENDIIEQAEEAFGSIQFSEDIDPADVADAMINYEVELYESALTMKSNHIFITISMLAHMWEQQVVRFVSRELMDVYGQKIPLPYSKALEVIIAHGINVREKEYWIKIDELRQLVNTIKHAEGHSAKKLRRLRPDFFETEGISKDKPMDILEVNDSVLLDPYSLNVKETDLFDYIKATQGFWGEMPDRAFYDFETKTGTVVND